MKKLLFSQIIIMLFWLVSCTEQSNYQSEALFSMNTYTVVTADTTDKAVFDGVERLLTTTEQTYSTTINTSLTSKINENTTTTVDKEYAEVIRRLICISKTTKGAFNPCLGLITSLWDITGKKHIPTDEEICELLPFCDYSSVIVSETEILKNNNQTKLDLGAAIKGYAAEKSIEYLKNNGVNNAMISIGGNIAVTGHSENGSRAWRVGIKNPFNTETIAGYIDCTDTVISVSGDYERFFEKDGVIYHHIFDSKTGKPAESDIKSVAVISSDGLLSDALSTALFVMGADKSLELYNSGVYNFEAIMILKDKTVLLTNGIYDSFVVLKDSGLTLN